MTHIKQNNNSRLKILFISAHTPKPDGAGSEKRAWAHLLALSKSGAVNLCILTSKGVVNASENTHLNGLVSKVSVLTAKKFDLTVSNIPGKSLLKELIFGSSLKYSLSKGSVENLNALLQVNNFDVLFCFRWQAGWVAKKYCNTVRKSTKIFVDLDDIDSKAMERQLSVDQASLGKELRLIYQLRIRRQQSIEQKLAKFSHILIICSDSDNTNLSDRFSCCEVATIPNCIAIPDMKQTILANKKNQLTLLFVGTMSYLPNEDAILYFHKQIYPEIKRQLNPTKLVLNIVGFSPSKHIQSLSDGDGIVVTGGVDSVEPYYLDADLVICPIRHGGGTRIKILEAMSYGCATVSTVIGAEGIDVEHNKNILLSDNTIQFQEHCVELLRNKELRSELGKAGKKLVTQKYSINVIIKKIQQLIKS